MGGEVLELLTDRLERAEQMERDARERGIEQGRELGREQGRNEGIEALAEKLRELGVDERLVAEAVAASREDESQ